MNESNVTPKTEAQLLPLAQAGDMAAALELAKLYLDNHNPALQKWANTLCAGGMPEGYYLLGKCYQFGIAVEPDLAEAERLYRKSAEMGFPRALRGIASLLIVDPEKRAANMPEAIRLLKQAANQGDEKAMYVLALFYQKGEGVARSGRKEFELLCSSAELGYAPAMTALGEIYLNESESPDQGIEWLQKAVALGDDNAQRVLDKLSDTKDKNASSDDLKDNPEFLEFMEELKNDAAESFRRKDQMIADAEVGDPDAQYQLGVAYCNGHTEDGIPLDQNFDTGRQWLEKAARQGHNAASFELGVISDGQGDYETSIKWYLAAANNGYMAAVSNLGLAYEHIGQEDKAFMWFKKGVETGIPHAMSRLAHYYENGSIVEQDMDEAVRLYRASAQGGDLYGSLRFINFCLTPEHRDIPAAEASLIKLANASDAESQTILATIYLGLYGEEFEDLAIAEDLLDSAVMQDNVEAHHLRGLLYYHIDADKEWAYEDLSYAASKGHQGAKEALRDLFDVD